MKSNLHRTGYTTPTKECFEQMQLASKTSVFLSFRRSRNPQNKRLYQNRLCSGTFDANVCDNTFNEVLVSAHQADTGVYSDGGFRRSKKRGGNPLNLVICERGQQNERMLVETVFSLLTGVLHMKKLFQRAQDYLEARLGFAVAIYNLLVTWNGVQTDEAGRTKLSIAEFAL